MPADTNTSGTYIITYRVEDAQGNVEVAERKLVITSKPTINFEDNYIVATNDTFDPMAGVTASDRENGDLTTSILVTSNPVDTSSVGSYIVVYEVTDSDGNKTIRERTIIVTGEPVILHPGDTTIAFGSTFDKLEGVTASDPEDGSLTSQIVVGGDDVNTNTVGTYTIFYSVVDSVGSRTTVYRVITVTKVPTFGDMSDVYIKVDDSYDPLEGVTATDPEDGNLTARIVVTSGSIDSSTPGEYVITYSVTDNDGYTVVATRSIFVTEPPVIHAEDTIIEVNSEFDVATYATVTDLEDETLPVSYTFIGTEFDATVPGVYTIEYSAEDSHGFVTTKRITVTVAGSPVISGIDDIRVNPNSIFIPMNGVTATD